MGSSVDVDKGGHEMTIREIRPEEAPAVTDVYVEACRLLAEIDPDSGIPDWGAINRWITRTTETDEAVCLIKEVDGTIVGYLLASVERHPASRVVRGSL
jgi:L-amino acid N-acyltransferase YncA